MRSAKQVVLDLIGRNLDDHLYRECLAAYTLMADNPSVPQRLKNFYDKKDRGRDGANSTGL